MFLAVFSQKSALLQEAEHLITAPRPRCMMEAGHLDRVELGTPTIPTHHQGKRERLAYIISQFNLDLMLLIFLALMLFSAQAG